MNTTAKYVLSVFALAIVAYVGWAVIQTMFPVDEWFQQNPSWRTIFHLLIIVGVVGVISAVVKLRGR